MRKKLHWFILAIIVYACLEAGCFLSLFLQKKLFHIEYAPLQTSLSDEHRYALTLFIQNKPNYLTFSSTLGWAIKKHGASPPLYQANSQGIRASTEYSFEVPKDIVRLTTFGDSFTHCDDVKNEETWQEQLTQRTDFEVMNFGVPAFGLDQAFLRYQYEGVQYHPHIVLMGFMSENIFRHVNVFRPFYDPPTWTPLTKPRYLVQQEQLVLLENPMQELSHYEQLLTHPEDILPELGRHDYFYKIQYKQGFFDFLPSVRLFKIESYKFIRKYKYANIITGKGKNSYYNEQSEAFHVTTKIFDAFYKSTTTTSTPIILVLPNKEDILRYRENGTKIYAPFLAYFETQNYQYIDLLNAFETYGRDFKVKAIFSARGHYSPLGNQIVATYIGRYLQEKILGKL